MNIELLRTLQARIFDQLEASYPNEGGGFLLGKLRDDTVIIEDVVPIENVFAAEEQHHRYTMTPQDWMRLEDEAERDARERQDAGRG
ncbi:MAG: Mov34/MPN/PAD-1 family protein [Anaerolineae bacterium]|nr:Mov34/MPN/PAD-1 family protein [Anaerolineae bacterium]